MDALSFFTRSLRDHDLSASPRRSRTPSVAAPGLSSAQTLAVNSANAFRVDQLLRRKSEAALKQKRDDDFLRVPKAGDPGAASSECQVLYTRAAALAAECGTLHHSIEAANAKIAELADIRESLTASLASAEARSEVAQSAHDRDYVSRHELVQKSAEFDTIKADLSWALRSQKMRGEDLTAKLAGATEELERARRVLGKLREERKGLDAQLKTAAQTSREQSEKLKQALDVHKSDLQKATGRITQLGSMLASRGRQVADAEKARADIEAKANETQTTLSTLRKNLTLAQNEATTVAAERDELAGRVKSLQEANAELDTKLAAATLAANTLPSSHSQELFSLNHQLEESDRLRTAAAHEHAALVSTLKAELDELRSVAETNARFHGATRRELDAARVRAEEARFRAGELGHERARQAEQLQVERANWQQERAALISKLDAATANQTSLVHNAAAERSVYQAQLDTLKAEHARGQQQLAALAAQLDAARTAADAQGPALRRAEADRDVYQAQARHALSALSAAQRDAADAQKGARAAAAELARERDALAHGLADARRLGAQHAAQARALEARNAVLEQELEAARDAEREARERTLVDDLVGDGDALGALREALGAYVAAVDDCEAVWGRGGLVASTPAKRAGGAVGTQDAFASAFFGSTFTA